MSRHFHNYLPWKNAVALQWYNIALEVLEKVSMGFFHSLFFTISQSLKSPLGKIFGPSFEKSPCLPRILCVKSMAVDIGPVVLEKKMKIWKVYYNENNRQWTFLQSEKLTSAFGSDELKIGAEILYNKFIRYTG